MKITLTGISAVGFHGVLEEERQSGQSFIVDVTLSVAPPIADALSATIDYSGVATAITSLITGEPVQLIETLAGHIAEALLAGWPGIRRVTVTVHKPQAPIAAEFEDICATVSRRAPSGPATPFVLSLGANLGDAQTTLRLAIDSLRFVPQIAVNSVSDVYRTTPVDVGEDDQPDYFNLVVIGQTTLDPFALLRRTAAIETHFGRVRPYPHAPRSLDIDLIDMGNTTVQTDSLVLPHPRAAERGFVLVPWAQIAPDAMLATSRVSDLAARFDDSSVLRIGPLS